MIEINHDKLREHPHDKGSWYYIDDNDYAEEILAKLFLLGCVIDKNNTTWDSIDFNHNKTIVLRHRAGNAVEEKGVWQINLGELEDFLAYLTRTL